MTALLPTPPPALLTPLQDSTHTFPDHAWLSSPDGRAALCRVLQVGTLCERARRDCLHTTHSSVHMYLDMHQAYSVHNERVGYVRAMNTIVGLMLVALNRNEEAAFWLLAALVEDILYPGTYSRNLEGCQVRKRRFGRTWGKRWW